MSTKRQPKGIPIGGQYAENSHDEAASALDAIIESEDILHIDAEHIDAVQGATNEHSHLVTEKQARGLLSAPSGERPRMYGLRHDENGYQIVKLSSEQSLDQPLVAQWTSDTQVSDLVSPAAPRGRWEDDRERFERLRDEPTADDLSDTLESITVDISNASFPNGENSWDKVMGRGARRTAANVERYQAHLAEVAAIHPGYKARHEEYARANAKARSFERAFEQGIAIHPVAEEYFESVWNDDNAGYGEAGTRRRLQENEEYKVALAAGRMKPSDLVGSGLKNPRKSAEEYLERTERALRRELQTRGRSNSVLASNAHGRVARAEGL